MGFNIFDYVSQATFFSLSKALVFIIVGIILASLLSSLAGHATKKFAHIQQQILLKRIIYFGIIILFLIPALQQLGFELGALIGAAGVITIGIGFAAKTSVSNMISGIFLTLEKTFDIGDSLMVNGSQGKVVSTDLLSVKLQSADNTLIRIPNEVLIKTPFVNLTHFPQRRIDLSIGVGYEQNIETVKTTLLEIASQQEKILKLPAPQFSLNNFGDSAINLQFCAWVNTANYAEVKTNLQIAIKEAFAEKNINIPYPQLVLHRAEDCTDSKA